MSEPETKTEIVNDGAGINVTQAADLFEKTGLADAVDSLNDEDTVRAPGEGIAEYEQSLKARGIEDPGIREVESPGVPHEEPSQPRQQSQQPQPPQPYQPPPVQPLPPQQPQGPDPRAVLAQATQAFQNLDAELQAVTANREQLAQQYSPAEVATYERDLRGQLAQVQDVGKQAAAAAQQQQFYFQQQQRQQAAYFQQQQQAAIAQELAAVKREFHVNDVELRNLQLDARAIGRANGLSDWEMQNSGPREARLLLQQAQQAQQLRDAERSKQAAVKRVAQKVAAASRKQSEPSAKQWGRPAADSTEAAASAFLRMGVV